MSVAEVLLWGTTVGAVAWDKKRGVADFQYSPDFIKSGIHVSPLMMPLSSQVFSFPELNKSTFHGLPGFLADSLPDKFGNALIDLWLAKEGRSAADFNPVERLCYMGKRGIGALEFRPSHSPYRGAKIKINIDSLVDLASEILTHRSSLKTSFVESHRGKALRDILRVGTSAGGARAKAVIAWNPATNEVRSGQADCDDGFSHWILKFDGVSGNKDKELDDPKGFGLIEYAYYKMALAAGINMSESRLLNENGRSHFMTKRFDRNDSGDKVHMQSLCGIAHFDYNLAGAYSYEQVIDVIRQLGLSMSDIEEQFRRMVFNIIARNQDDHVKNIAFLMDRRGKWSLSPAFDVVYSYNPNGLWTSQHQMSMNGKRDDFCMQDFLDFADRASMMRSRAKKIISQVRKAVCQWNDIAQDVGVSDERRNIIKSAHRPL